ncbi:hypothetical protein GJ744_001544 [Endocarpon pusillum]|uniref:Uncharacterized protein n=1 Tax=Endocarpon pusillum TaxID=364733 RepID=A0A8H7A9F5_9EURO|nr:hypothetical protein GJ744_001544 [Endocarpon pusillum]
MAGGRRHYALETLAHRDGYTIKDVDGVDGIDVGSRRWQAECCPPILEVGWDGVDVLGRWRRELKNASISPGSVKQGPPPDVRLSGDAGRFLCDFIFYESLSLRWKEDREGQELQSQGPLHDEVQQPLLPSLPLTRSPALESLTPPSSEISRVRSHADDDDNSKLGKVAFLHVPGDTDALAIERGVRVTIAAIRALVSSWEEGYRRGGGGKPVRLPSPSDGDTRSRRGMVGVEFMS